MGVYIKGMEIPKSCYVCPFCDYVSARCDAVQGNPYTQESRYEKRDDFCPLVPVPEPHGRLIDADALRDNNSSVIEINSPDGTVLAIDVAIIDDAPTVIPASTEGN